MAVCLPPSLSAAQRLPIYDKDEQLNGGGLLKVRTEFFSKVWRDVEDSPGWPYVHFMVPSVTVAEGGMRCRPPFHGPCNRLFSVAAPSHGALRHGWKMVA